MIDVSVPSTPRTESEVRSVTRTAVIGDVGGYVAHLRDALGLGWAARHRVVHVDDLAQVMGWPDQPDRALRVAATVVADGQTYTWSFTTGSPPTE